MTRWIAVSAFLLLAVAACESTDPDEERWKRDMFKVPRYQAKRGEQQRLDSVGEVWGKGDEHHYAALAEDNPVKKKQLLRQAIACYSRALGELEALRDASRNADERDRYDLLTLKVKEDITNSKRLMPITGE
jgi:hypothetical protein